jgi:hypothetical protein|tara:strand:- start:442 stop:549 length:108 start_codon:yes stop_codon:yes gene_type:complete
MKDFLFKAFVFLFMTSSLTGLMLFMLHTWAIKGGL